MAALSPGQRIRLWLDENDMSQDELAKRLGVSRNTVSRWVNDHHPPTRARMKGRLDELTGLRLEVEDARLAEARAEVQRALREVRLPPGDYTLEELDRRINELPFDADLKAALKRLMREDATQRASCA